MDRDRSELTVARLDATLSDALNEVLRAEFSAITQAYSHRQLSMLCLKPR
jgi:hypothetical protein